MTSGKWSFKDAMLAYTQHLAAQAAANGETPAGDAETISASDPTAGHKDSSPPRQPDGAIHCSRDLEGWARPIIDDELEAIRTDQPGERNSKLNDRALRCFRVAMRACMDLDDVHDKCFAAAQVAGAVPGDPHTDTQIRATLRSARAGAQRHGPADDDVIDRSGSQRHRDRRQGVRHNHDQGRRQGQGRPQHSRRFLGDHRRATPDP
jgi:hypothetical protein